MVFIIEFSVSALQFPFISNSSTVGDLYLHLYEDAISSNPGAQNWVLFLY